MQQSFRQSAFAHRKAVEWSGRDEEFAKRAGFVLMATLAVHDKKADDEVFLTFLPIIKNGSTDERNFVKKAVNWTLRQIGKRNANLNKAAIKTAEEIKTINSKSARWIAADALRKLTSEAVARTVNKFSLDSLLSQIDENNVHSEIKTSSAQGNEAW